MEHVEEAGVHSGDSACVIPPPTLDEETVQAHRGPHAPHRGRPRGPRAAQRPVRRQAASGLRHRGEPSGQPDGPLRRQGDRGATRQDRGADDARRHARRAPRRRDGCSAETSATDAREREGGRPSLRPVPRRRLDPRSGDALDRRGDGDRPHVRARLRQEPDRSRQPPARRGGRLLVARRPRQGGGGGRRRVGSRSSVSRLVATEGTAEFLETARSGRIETRVAKVGQPGPGMVDAVELIASGKVQLVVNTPRGRGPRGRRCPHPPGGVGPPRALPHDRCRRPGRRRRHRRLGPPPPRGAQPPGAPPGAGRAPRLFADPAP